MTDEHDLVSKFRRIGSTGLVIFERDGILVRQNGPLRELMLGDINEEFVEMLKRLRDRNIRFGFISDQRGMAAGTYGQSEFFALTGVLDGLLSIRGAMPDFWMGWPHSPRVGPQFQDNEAPPRVDATMITRAMDWYGVDKKSVVFVTSSPQGILASDGVDVTRIRYSGWQSEQPSTALHEMEIGRNLSLPEITEVRLLGATIERIVGQRRRTG